MPSILATKDTSAPSVFLPSVLLREARRQKGLASVNVPPVCILDPDGDIVRELRQAGYSRRFENWPCYHTELDTFSSGCRLLVSLTSAGQVKPAGPPPYFVVIDRALRDEGTSYHYTAPSEFAEADPALVATAAKALATLGLRNIVGASWTTDAPFRETEEAIRAAHANGTRPSMNSAKSFRFAREGIRFPRNGK